jgi:hypothetical protein
MISEPRIRVTAKSDDERAMTRAYPHTECSTHSPSELVPGSLCSVTYNIQICGYNPQENVKLLSESHCVGKLTICFNMALSQYRSSLHYPWDCIEGTKRIYHTRKQDRSRFCKGQHSQWFVDVVTWLACMLYNMFA